MEKKTRDVRREARRQAILNNSSTRLDALKNVGYVQKNYSSSIMALNHHDNNLIIILSLSVVRPILMAYTNDQLSLVKTGVTETPFIVCHSINIPCPCVACTRDTVVVVFVSTVS